jgi:hypothetical protein
MQICYLLAFPDNAKTETTPTAPIKGLKDAPYFQPVDVAVVSLGQQPVHVEGISVTVLRQRLDERVQILECRFDLPETLSQNAIQHRQRVERALNALFLPIEYQQSGLYEEYIILLVSAIQGTPDEFIEQNAGNLARFMRSQREIFDPAEIDEILVSRVRYSRDELTLVDWDGAAIISPVGDFQSDIELLKIGNYQLLRYRMLDQSIEASLRQISAQFKAKSQGALQPGPSRSSLRRIVGLRMELMLDFEHTDQNLLLIGDWYTAKLYHAIRDELYLDNWKQAIQDKLDNLENISTTIQEHFALSWRGLMEQVELIGWIVLLIGYFVLFFMEEIKIGH